MLKPGSVKICASPSDIKHLAGMEKDIRTVDKLINGKINSEDLNIWLTAFKNTKSNAAANSKGNDKREPNFVCFIFERPTCVSAI